jgi:CheY-like chemotaxis protein
VLPLQESKIQAVQKENAIVDTQTMDCLNKVKLLLVEDNEFNRMVAEDTLKELLPGIIIDIAVNGSEAVQRVQQETYDLVLMDIQMPVMDGLTATKIIRNLPGETGRVKIIAMTANVLQEDVQEYLQAGMNAYVSKPFQADELILKMVSVLEKNGAGSNNISRHENKPAPMLVQQPELNPLPDKVTDMHFMMQFAGGNVEKMNKYIGMFLQNAPNLIANLETGLQNKDFTAIKIAAHSLKPQLSYMGVKEEISHIFLLEQTAGEAHYDRIPRLIANVKRVCEQAFKELNEVKNGL